MKWWRRPRRRVNGDGVQAARRALEDTRRQRREAEPLIRELRHRLEQNQFGEKVQRALRP